MLLKENGCIFMTNWNLLSTMNQKKYAPREVGGCDFDVKIGKSSRFYHGFDTNELTELFREAGFEYISHDVGERNIVSIARI